MSNIDYLIPFELKDKVSYRIEKRPYRHKFKPSSLPNKFSNYALKRQNEYLEGRSLLFDILTTLEIVDIGNLLPQSDRTVNWPDNVSGTLTHCEKYIAGVVYKKEGFHIGIDIEKIILEPDKDFIDIITNGDHEDLENSSLSSSEYYTLLFSAKESFYKAVYPIVKSYIGFKEVRFKLLSINENGEGEFLIKPLFDHKFINKISGKFLIVEDHIFTLSWVTS